MSTIGVRIGVQLFKETTKSFWQGDAQFEMELCRESIAWQDISNSVQLMTHKHF